MCAPLRPALAGRVARARAYAHAGDAHAGGARTWRAARCAWTCALLACGVGCACTRSRWIAPSCFSVTPSTRPWGQVLADSCQGRPARSSLQQSAATDGTWGRGHTHRAPSLADSVSRDTAHAPRRARRAPATPGGPGPKRRHAKDASGSFRACGRAPAGMLSRGGGGVLALSLLSGPCGPLPCPWCRDWVAGRRLAWSLCVRRPALRHAPERCGCEPSEERSRPWPLPPRLSLRSWVSMGAAPGDD